jgi:2-dehydro-3-deoxygalactonokinase
LNHCHLLALDWGSSTLRAAWLDDHGQAIEERSFARGVLTVQPSEFPEVFQNCVGDWMQRPGALCLMSGMVGSQQGWQQAAYCACPAGFDEVAAKLSWIEPGRIAIVPGLYCDHAGLAESPDLSTIPDVMRGEETQILGALQGLGMQDGLLVLPGTHSKWAHVQGGKIHHFSTFMTGEFYALLRQHSILSRTLPAVEDTTDWPAFDQGIAVAERSASLLQSAFSVRALSLFDRLPAASRNSYLSGLVIGEELRAQVSSSSSNVVLIGADALTLRYARAFSTRGASVKRVGAEATWLGLWALAQRLSTKGGK